MNQQILDTPFKDSFFYFLEKGETIIWQGQPSLVTPYYDGNDVRPADDYDNHIFWSLLIMGMVFFIFIKQIPIIAFVYFFGLLFFGKILPSWVRNKKTSIRYAITQKQLLFQFKKVWSNNTTCYSIPFSKIKNIVVIATYDVERIKKYFREAEQPIPDFYNKEGLDKIGTIFIGTHHPELVPFETKDLNTNNKRHQPTIELLDNVEEVAALIKRQIQNLRY